jgi:predicted transcriptional regulator
VPNDRRTGQKPVALTVKIDGGTYVRLGTLRASQRRTHQDILKQALEEYLDREGA